MNVTFMKEKLKKMPLFSRGDIILIAVVTAVALLLFVWNSLSAEGETAVVTLDGETVTVINLETAEDEIFTVGDVTVQMKNGCVSIIDSDCNDKTCVKTGELSKSGDVSACVPNRVSVEITGDSEDGVDIMSY